MREAARERSGSAGEGESAVLAKIAKMKEPDRKGEENPRDREGGRPRTHPNDLVRDAGLCQRRQGHLLVPRRCEVQDEVRDIGLQRQGAS
jgi:hypothetical protein